MIVLPRPTGPCWNCANEVPLEVLKGVRLIKCACGAIHPHLSARLVLRFINPDKVAYA